jgi:hypothetical protein
MGHQTHRCGQGWLPMKARLLRSGKAPPLRYLAAKERTLPSLMDVQAPSLDPYLGADYPSPT